MSQHIMQLSTFEIHAGKLDAFKASIEKAVNFAEAHGPQLLVEVYIDEAAMRAHSCQIQRDSDAILKHWRLADPFIQKVMGNCTLKRLDIYGDPDETVLEGLRPLEENGVAITITPGFAGFGRFED